MNTATLEVPPEYASDFHKWLCEEVTDAARELAEYERAKEMGECPDDPEGAAYRRRTMIQGAKLLEQADNRRPGDSAKYQGDARVLSDVLDGMLNGKADQLDHLCGVGPVDYGSVLQHLEGIEWLAREGERVDAIDREKAVA